MSNYPPSLTANRDEFFSYEQWRERFLQVVLRGSCLLGFIAIVLYLFSSSTALYKVLAIATYGILVLVTLLDQLQYRIRSGVFLFLLYLSGLSSLLDHGLADASILFLGFIVMACLLISLRAGGYFAIGLTFLTILLFGWSSSSLEGAARLTGILFVVAAIVAIGLRTLEEEFTKTLTAARQTFDTL